MRVVYAECMNSDIWLISFDHVKYMALTYVLLVG